MDTSSDRIVKTVLLRAPLERVWRAISEAPQFGAWFGVAFDGPFVEGAKLLGRIVPTQADAEVAKTQEPYRGAKFEIVVDRIEPMRRFCFRWHPFAVDSEVDYSKEPLTLVAFALEEAAGGTRLTITESGFDSLPASRRATAFSMNEEGWTAQATLVEKYLSHAS
jgi:uncharacterized protein YndB with AHSA1/START domain